MHESTDSSRVSQPSRTNSTHHTAHTDSCTELPSCRFCQPYPRSTSHQATPTTVTLDSREQQIQQKQHKRFVALPPEPDITLFPRYIRNAQGLWLRYSEWWPIGTPLSELVGVVFIVIGVGEYSGRYDGIAMHLNRSGFVVFALDNQGAGGSDGVHASYRLYIHSIAHLVNDASRFVHTMLHERYARELSSLPCVLLGHSMGGLIATRLAQTNEHAFDGVVLSGPALMTDVSCQSWRGWLLLKLARIVPLLPVKFVSLKHISNNEAVRQRAAVDPLYERSAIRAGMAAAILQAQEQVMAEAAKSDFPFLIVHGACDKICLVQGSQNFYAAAATPVPNKQIRIYDDCMHEVLTDVRREEVMNDVMEFVFDCCARARSMNLAHSDAQPRKNRQEA